MQQKSKFVCVYGMSVVVQCSKPQTHTKFDCTRCCFNSKCLWFSGEKYMNNLTKFEMTRCDKIGHFG